jgi:hypothetical protein
MGFLSACEQNTFVPPAAAKVDVAMPVQTVFHALSGGDRQHRRAIKNVDLVARVQGFLQSINL